MSSQDHAYALPSGFMLEEYQIERVLGSGGFGITYYAWDRHLDKAVAIKEYLPNEFAVRYEDTTVAPKSSSDAETYEWGLTRFLEEARILAGFDHPNINKVYRRLEAHGTAYMVLEYLPGESLSARLRRTGRLSPDEVWRLFNELLSGLAEVHRQDYVHRDIKPGNIMFREDGGAVLLDFGAARQAVGQRSKSITSILTPGYAPIEQYDQKAVYVGPWTDFYALGVVAYRCVTGVREGELLDAPARSLLVLHGEREKDMPLAVEAAKGGYDKRLLNAIDWCMQVDKRERPQGVADLEKALAGGASKVKKKPKPKPAPKHPTRRVAAIVLLLMLAPWLGFGVWQWFSPSPPAPPPLADDPGEASAPAVVPAPPPPPRVAAEPGSLMLELSPADAQVILPDIESPYRPGMALAAGSYRVVVRQAGYEEFAGTLRIEADRRTTRTITLAEEPGSLMLELEPRDAQVMLPDIESSYRPGLALPAGEYRVVVRREGYETFEDTLRIEAGRRTVRAITLVEAAGSLVLELSPEDAQVSLPDSRLPYRPGMALPAGEYRVLVRRAGYAEFSGTLRIEAGQRTTRAITLAEEPGSLVLELSPADAQVSLPDIESPYRPGLALPAGEYRVVVRRAGYEAFDDTLRIEAGQRTTRAITLVEELGSLMLEIEPRDAQVILPDIGPRYRPGLALPAGEYRVVVRQAGYEEFEGSVRIEAGQRTTRAITLRRTLIRRFEHGSYAVYSVAFAPDGATVLTGGTDDTARLWNAQTGAEIRRFEGHGSSVYSVAFAPDGATVLTGSGDDTARLWNAQTGAEIRRFEGHRRDGIGVESVAFSPDGATVLTGSHDGTARLWNAQTGAEIRRFEGHGDHVESVAFSPDGATVLTGSTDHTARLWNAQTGAEIHRFEGHGDGVESVAFSPDGATVLTGSRDLTARLWNAQTGAEIHRLGHGGWVHSVAFSPDGATVLTGDLYGRVRLWNAQTGAEIRRFKGDTSSIESVAFSPDGATVLTGSHDAARLWNAQTGAEIR